MMTRILLTLLSLVLLIATPVEAKVSKQPAAKKQTVKKQTTNKPGLKRTGIRKQSAQQQAARQDEQLLELDLNTRVEQRCDLHAADAISREHQGFQVDKVIAYAFSDAEVHGTDVIAPGAIARNKGKWYRLTFRCRTTSDGLGIVSFEHELGPEVPGWDQSELAN
jgi:hypothetical protein